MPTTACQQHTGEALPRCLSSDRVVPSLARASILVKERWAVLQHTGNECFHSACTAPAHSSRLLQRRVLGEICMDSRSSPEHKLASGPRSDGAGV